jgi:hypothetical protein
MANLEIRTKMKKEEVCQWEVADCMGISEFTLTRWLRKELSDEQKGTVMEAIRVAANKKYGCTN